MPFFNSKKRKDCISEYETTLSLILAHINIFKRKQIPIIILGDFNADPFRSCLPRQNFLDELFSKFVKDNEFIMLDILNTQKIPYTYQVLYNSNIFKSIQCNIIEDLGNLSDHLSLKIDFSVDSKQNNSPVQNVYIPRPNSRIKFEQKKLMNFSIKKLNLIF